MAYNRAIKAALFSALLFLVCGLGFLFACKNNEQKTAEQLAQPAIILDGNVVSWDAVANADGYEIFVDGEMVKSVSSLAYALTRYSAGTYVVQVRAISQNSELYAASPLSDSVTYVVTDYTPQIKPDTPTVDEPIVDEPIVDDTVVDAPTTDAPTTDTPTTDTPTTDTPTTDTPTTDTPTTDTPTTDTPTTDTPTTDTPTTEEPKQDEQEKEQPKEVTFTKLKKASDPAKTVYSTDEGAVKLDLTGLKVYACYSDESEKEVTLTEENVVSSYDLSKEGRYEIYMRYSDASGVSGTIAFRINVQKTSAENVECAQVINQYDKDAATYIIADFEAQSASDAYGNALSISVSGGKTYAAAGQLSMGENMVKLTCNGEVKYVNVLVAYLLKDAEDFEKINDDLNGYYLMVADIDLTGYTKTIGTAPVYYEDGFVLEPENESGYGAAFNGTFNGNGYTIYNYTIDRTANEWGRFEPKIYAAALFAYLGHSGKVCNLTLSNVTIKGRAYTSFIAGVNLGTIENICIERDCYLLCEFASGAVASAYNYGTVKNVVCFIEKGEFSNSRLFNLCIVRNQNKYTSESGINGYICDYSDLSAILGDGWVYIDDYGTVYVNDNYKKIVGSDEYLYVGKTAEVTVYQNTFASLAFTTDSDIKLKVERKNETDTWVLQIDGEIAEGTLPAEGQTLTVTVSVGESVVGTFSIIVSESNASSDVVASSEADLTKIYTVDKGRTEVCTIGG